MDSCNYDKDTPLHVAAANGKFEDVMHLLDERKACLFVRNRYVLCPIHEENKELSIYIV